MLIDRVTTDDDNDDVQLIDAYVNGLSEVTEFYTMLHDDNLPTCHLSNICDRLTSVAVVKAS